MVYWIYRRKVGKRYSTRWVKTNWGCKEPDPLFLIIEDIKSKRNGRNKIVNEYKVVGGEE